MQAQIISYDEFAKRKRLQEREKRTRSMRARFAKAMGMELNARKKRTPWF
ncbi:hypothetical protein ACKC9G_05155 [Pokkaliibacter sp. CJK22405]